LNNASIEKDLGKLRGGAEPFWNTSPPEQATQAGIDETTDARGNICSLESMKRLKKTSPTSFIGQHVINERNLASKFLIHASNQDS